jgi:urate oxidase
MKSNKIYFVKFTKSVDVNGVDDNDFTHPIYSDLNDILDVNESKYLGFTNDENLFIRLLDYKVKSVLDVFSKHGFEFKVFDVTSKVISGDIQKMYPEVQDLTPYMFDDFRLENTTQDDVLDKILEKGIDSLDDLDKRILSA